VTDKRKKIGTTDEADQALERMVTRVNDGFRGGRIGKQEMASWIIQYFERHGFSESIGAVRAEHFDQVAFLGSVAKNFRIDVG